MSKRNDFKKDGMMKRKNFEITIQDARRIVESLEFSADFDKTEIYYHVKKWIEENDC